MSKRRSIKLAVNNGAKVAEVDKEGKEDDDEKEIGIYALFVKLKDQRNFNHHQMLDESVGVKPIMI